MNKQSRRNKDLASLFAIEDEALQRVAAAHGASSLPGIVVQKTTLPGGGQPGDPTAASFEYNDELESSVGTV